MILALLLMQATVADVAQWDGLPIPDKVGVEASRYISCIGDPVLDVVTTGEPADPAARKALMDKVLVDCRPVRAAVTTEIDAKMATTPGWTDPLLRRAKVARMLDAAEERVGYSAINREDFLKMVEQIRQCVAAGDKDCDKGPALKPQ